KSLDELPGLPRLPSRRCTVGAHHAEATEQLDDRARARRGNGVGALERRDENVCRLRKSREPTRVCRSCGLASKSKRLARPRTLFSEKLRKADMGLSQPRLRADSSADLRRHPVVSDRLLLAPQAPSQQREG